MGCQCQAAAVPEMTAPDDDHQRQWPGGGRTGIRIVCGSPLVSRPGNRCADECFGSIKGKMWDEFLGRAVCRMLAEARVPTVETGVQHRASARSSTLSVTRALALRGQG